MSDLADAATIFRKELLELAGDWQAARGALAQTAIMILFLGVYLPSTDSMLWSNSLIIGVIFFLFPSLLAATVASDAFAGERERGTLETLLATPISDSALFFGKAAWAVAYSFISAGAALACGLMTTLLRYGSVERYVPAVAVLAAAGDALVATVFTAAIATFVSTKTIVSRTATQVSRVVAVASGALLVVGVQAVEQRLGWAALFLLQVVLLACSLALIRLSAARFRRDRILTRR
jgi:ABC-2 type transport system permease protein